MKIRERFGDPRPLFSFEFFPPRDDRGVEALFDTVSNLKALGPAFVSVTYGAGGSTRANTVAITRRIKRETGIEAMAHITCVGHSREEIGELLDEYEDAGIENVMALRGDPPRGDCAFVPHAEGFSHADQLVAFIRRRKDFCIGGAGYPETHPEAPSREEDLRNLRRKTDAGCDFVVTQLFFDERDYFDFAARARTEGIRAPIIPGVMPVTNIAQIKRFTRMCGAAIPQALLARLEAAAADPDAVIEVGIEHAVRQCRALLRGGAPGIHFYTLNRSLSTRKILAHLQGPEPERG